MKANEFLEMIAHDVQMTNKELAPVYELMKSVLNGTEEIDGGKTLKDCFETMKSAAKKKAKDGCYCMSDDEARKIIIDYLGVTETKAANTVNLEDFF